MKRLLILLLRVYQKTISPLSISHCRFRPTCSQYAVEALEKRGVIVGLALAIWRFLRCNPFNKNHGWDPVPEKGEKRKKNKNKT